jgi:trimeric autotransporter adhesin
MRTALILTLLVLCLKSGFTQSPNVFNYQAVLRDASGNVKSNTVVEIQVDLLQGSASGSPGYSESFALSTNVLGLINLQIGKGSVIYGTFSSINWGAGPYFMKVSVGGSEIGTSQLLSVPYALFAGTAANAFSGNYDDLINKPTILDGNYNTSTGYQSLFSKTSGSNNIANGHLSLYYNTGGSSNTAMGFRALYFNTLGSYNTAIGSEALYSNS